MNPVDYMLDDIDKAGIDTQVVPKKRKSRRPWWKLKTEAEQTKAKDAIKKRHELIDTLWRKYEWYKKPHE